MIRIATEADVAAILEIYRPYVENTTITFEYDVPTQEAFLERFRGITAQYPWLVWEEAGRILGYAYAAAPYARAAYAWCAEPSVYLRPEVRRRGIGSRLYAVLEALLLRQGYQVLYALVTSENEASLRFHESRGYRLRAQFPDCAYKLGKCLGVSWLEKRLNPVEYPISSPTPWLSIVSNNQNFHDILDSLSLS